MRIAITMAAALLVPACAGPDAEVESAPGAGGGETADTAHVDDSTGRDAVAGDSAVCLLAGPFTAEGQVEVRAGSAEGDEADADRVGALRWEAHDGCERLVIDLLDAEGGAAAGPGRVTAEVLRDLGVVRVTLRDVEWVKSTATDTTFGGALARAVYAVFSPEGRWVYVDVHLGEAAEAAVTALQDPARVVVDLRPGGGPVPPPAPREDRVVVLEPRPGTAGYPLTVTGYARTFEANVVVRLERHGQEVYDDFTTATAWVDAWGHYSFTIPAGPEGEVVLHVGEHSARDGAWEGVAVPLRMR